MKSIVLHIVFQSKFIPLLHNGLHIVEVGRVGRGVSMNVFAIGFEHREWPIVQRHKGQYHSNCFEFLFNDQLIIKKCDHQNQSMKVFWSLQERIKKFVVTYFIKQIKIFGSFWLVAKCGFGKETVYGTTWGQFSGN